MLLIIYALNYTFSVMSATAHHQDKEYTASKRDTGSSMKRVSNAARITILSESMRYEYHTRY